MSAFKVINNSVLTVHENDRLLGQSLANGFRRLRRMVRTYVELSERAALAKLRTWR